MGPRRVSVPHPWVGSGSFLTLWLTGGAIGYCPHQLAQQPPLPAEIAPNPMETRVLQGEHLVWPPGISCAESVAEPSMWCGDQGWTAASGTSPLAAGSGCSQDWGKVPASLVPGEEQGQP